MTDVPYFAEWHGFYLIIFGINCCINANLFSFSDFSTSNVEGDFLETGYASKELNESYD